MFLVNVIPIAKTGGKDELTYFSQNDIDLGSLVYVSLGRRTVPAVVISKKKADSEKASIKSASFSIKKIEKTKSHPFFLPEFIEAVTEIASFFATSPGAVIYALTSNRVLENIDKIDYTRQERASNMHDLLLMQADDEDRFAQYRSLIREEFAKKRSVFFCLPTIQEIKTSKSRLEKGIEQYTFVLHSGLSKKETLVVYKKILTEPHPVLVVATGNYLHIPRADIGAYIVDRDASRAYRMITRPYIDIRKAVECVAKRMRCRAFFGDMFLPAETVYRYKNHEFHDVVPLKSRLLTTAKLKLIDMKVYKNSARKFKILSDELVALIKETRNENGRLFIFASRRGLSAITACGDCGTIVSCSTCGSSLVLHSSQSGNFFLCHKCGERRSPKELCRNCTSWKLTPLGIGIELVRDAILELDNRPKLFVMDKDEIKSHQEATKRVQKFYDMPGSILLGTELALPYLTEAIEHTAVATVDALFAVPDYRINEKIIWILLKLRSLAKQTFLIQTRKAGERLFQYAQSGNLADFYREEIELRKQFNYPPFSVLIKISIEASREKVVSEMAIVQKIFADKEFEIFPSFIKGRRGMTLLHGLLRLQTETWPDPSVVSRLRALPPYFSVRIDPDSLL